MPSPSGVTPAHLLGAIDNGPPDVAALFDAASDMTSHNGTGWKVDGVGISGFTINAGEVDCQIESAVAFTPGISVLSYDGTGPLTFGGGRPLAPGSAIIM